MPQMPQIGIVKLLPSPMRPGFMEVISCYIMLYRAGSWGLKTNKHTVCMEGSSLWHRRVATLLNWDHPAQDKKKSDISDMEIKKMAMEHHHFRIF